MRRLIKCYPEFTQKSFLLLMDRKIPSSLVSGGSFFFFFTSMLFSSNKNKPKHKGLKLVGRMDITSKNLKQIRTVKFPFNNFISFFTNFYPHGFNFNVHFLDDNLQLLPSPFGYEDIKSIMHVTSLGEY